MHARLACTEHVSHTGYGWHSSTCLRSWWHSQPKAPCNCRLWLCLAGSQRLFVSVFLCVLCMYLRVFLPLISHAVLTRLQLRGLRVVRLLPDGSHAHAQPGVLVQMPRSRRRRVSVPSLHVTDQACHPTAQTHTCIQRSGCNHWGKTVAFVASLRSCVVA